MQSLCLIFGQTHYKHLALICCFRLVKKGFTPHLHIFIQTVGLHFIKSQAKFDELQPYISFWTLQFFCDSISDSINSILCATSLSTGKLKWIYNWFNICL